MVVGVGVGGATMEEVATRVDTSTMAWPENEEEEEDVHEMIDVVKRDAAGCVQVYALFLCALQLVAALNSKLLLVLVMTGAHHHLAVAAIVQNQVRRVMIIHFRFVE